ncbi:MAG: QueT transporter family protein [Clostridia bacterium]|nr:QueT transporter family protein [Clostridia bacterium]
MKRKNHDYVRGLTRGALTGALYVLLTYLSSLLGLSSGVVQLRISEMLCILPIFFPEAIPGLFIGCFISNIIAGGVIWDVIFGSIATLIGAFGAYFMRKLPRKLLPLATIPTIISNSAIIPLVLIYAYGAEGGFFPIMITVALGEMLSAGVLGAVFYYSIRRPIEKGLI